MSAIDIIILIIAILLVSAIIFFSYIYPRLKGESPTCASCPAVKKSKRLVKDYKKEHKCCCCNDDCDHENHGAEH